MTPDEYKLLIPELSPKWKKDNQKESDTRADRALTYAADIRKFEIELYWKGIGQIGIAQQEAFI
jgi:hypothetical protein